MDAPHQDDSPSQALWRAYYRWHAPGQVAEPNIEATWDRVALAVAGAEAKQPAVWCQRFRDILQDFSFLPAGQVLSGAGTGAGGSLSNCYAIAPSEDSVNGVFGALRESALALQAGAGIALDFSHMHPHSSYAAAGTAPCAGALSYLPLWGDAVEILQCADTEADSACIGLRCDHPDIASYIDAYTQHDSHHRVHRAVFLSDAFMEAVDKRADWPLVFPLGRHALTASVEVCERVWAGDTQAQPCVVHEHVAAASLWTLLLQDEYAHASPRIVFMDTIQRANNLWYAEQICVNSPCGSVPLPVGGACNRGCINLTRFVREPHSQHPQIDWPKLRLVSAVAVRFLDDVYDISAYPFKALSKAAHVARRLGLGITGLHSMFNMLGLQYGSQASLDLTDRLMQVIRDTAYQTSMEIAREKGPFPAFDKLKFAASPMVLNLSHELQDAIASYGTRNSHLIAVAPERRLSQLAHNVSPGIEPLAALPESTAQASLERAEAQLAMASAVQFHTDNAVAVNIHVPASTSSVEVGALLRQAWQSKLKNCRVVRARHPGNGAQGFDNSHGLCE